MEDKKKKLSPEQVIGRTSIWDTIMTFFESFIAVCVLTIFFMGALASHYHFKDAFMGNASQMLCSAGTFVTADLYNYGYEYPTRFIFAYYIAIVALVGFLIWDISKIVRHYKHKEEVK